MDDRENKNAKTCTHTCSTSLLLQASIHELKLRKLLGARRNIRPAKICTHTVVNGSDSYVYSFGNGENYKIKKYAHDGVTDTLILLIVLYY